MGINRKKTKEGKAYWEVSKRWPDASRFRRTSPNFTVATKTLARIEESIAMGTWERLKEELAHGESGKLTMNELADRYMREHCQVRNKRPEFKEGALKPVRKVLGGVPVDQLRRSDVHRFIDQRSREVAPATVNRSVAVIKNMMTFALERDLIETHPLIKFRMLPEERMALRVLTLEEERRLIECVEDPVIRAYVAVLGETGLRMAEGLNLRWDNVQLGHNPIVSVENTKSGKPRYIPLSPFAVHWLDSLVRVVGSPHVFSRLKTQDRYKDPRYWLEKAREKAGLEWASFHDLRHFRATQWVMHGVDLRTVQELLGHSSITTTMRYAHFAPNHATQSIRQVHAAEAEEAEAQRAKSGRTA